MSPSIAVRAYFLTYCFGVSLDSNYDDVPACHGRLESNPTAAEPHSILSMEPEEPAATSGQIQIGDLLIAVDGCDTVGLVSSCRRANKLTNHASSFALTNQSDPLSESDDMYACTSGQSIPEVTTRIKGPAGISFGKPALHGCDTSSSGFVNGC